MSALSMLTVTFRDCGSTVAQVQQFSVKGCDLRERDAIVVEFLRLLIVRGVDIIRVENLKDEEL